MNWALIGYGGMGSWHVSKLRTMKGIRIMGIYDILPERRKAAEKDGLYAYPTLEALLDDPKVEIVTIATPNDFHRPLAIAAMRAGKHVISEKPVTPSSDELQLMLDVARETGRVLTVHQNRRWDEDFVTAKKIIDDGTLGPVFHIESRVHGSRGLPGDWRHLKTKGGGIVLDWGVHLLDQILQIKKCPVVSVYSRFFYITCDEVEDGFTSLLTFGDGTTALVEVETSNFVELPRWYILGENGTAVIRDWHLNGEIVMVSDWEKRDAVPVETAAGLTKTMAPRTDETIRRYPLPKVKSDWGEFYKNVRNVLLGKEELIVKPEEFKRVMRLMEAIFASANENRTVHSII